MERPHPAVLNVEMADALAICPIMKFNVNSVEELYALILYVF